MLRETIFAFHLGTHRTGLFLAYFGYRCVVRYLETILSLTNFWVLFITPERQFLIKQHHSKSPTGFCAYALFFADWLSGLCESFGKTAIFKHMFHTKIMSTSRGITSWMLQNTFDITRIKLAQIFVAMWHHKVTGSFWEHNQRRQLCIRFSCYLHKKAMVPGALNDDPSAS